MKENRKNEMVNSFINQPSTLDKVLQSFERNDAKYSSQNPKSHARIKTTRTLKV